MTPGEGALRRSNSPVRTQACSLERRILVTLSVGPLCFEGLRGTLDAADVGSESLWRSLRALVQKGVVRGRMFDDGLLRYELRPRQSTPRTRDCRIGR